MRLHEYSVFARFRYNDLKVGISSGNQALKRCAFVSTNPTDEPITSGLPVIRAGALGRFTQRCFKIASGRR
jgi:hypothetical protein